MTSLVSVMRRLFPDPSVKGYQNFEWNVRADGSYVAALLLPESFRVPAEERRTVEAEMKLGGVDVVVKVIPDAEWNEIVDQDRAFDNQHGTVP